MTVNTHAIADRVRQIIARDELCVGERIGSERELADQLGVPRSSLRMALDAMESASAIRRTMGSAGGVFVSDGKIERQLNSLTSVPDLLRQQGFASATAVLDHGIGVATPSERRTLGLEDGEHVFRLVRRRDADGVPLSLDAMSLSLRAVPGFQKHDFSASVYGILSREYGIQLDHADETIDVVSATPPQALILGVEPGATLFEIWRVSRAQNRAPIEVSRDLFRADRLRISLHRYGARWKRAGAAASTARA